MTSFFALGDSKGRQPETLPKKCFPARPPAGIVNTLPGGLTIMDSGLHPTGGGTAVATDETIRLTIAEIEATPAVPEAPAPVSTTQRLLSLDAYRGLIMIT